MTLVSSIDRRLKTDMATSTFYRKANVTPDDAKKSLARSFPNAELVSFETKVASAEEAAAANAEKGDIVYVATVRVAEFPPTDDSGGDDSGSSDSAPEPKKEKSDDSSSDDDSGDSTDDAPSFDSKSDGDSGDDSGEAPKKMKPDEEMVHLLHQILDALKGGGAGLGDPSLDGPGAPGGLDLPDVGAPAPGDAMPPHGGPAGPGGPKPPLPPPIKEKSPIGAGAFAKHIGSRDSFMFIRQDVKADGLGHRALIREAMDLAPGYRVARLNVNEADDLAEVTMERI